MSASPQSIARSRDKRSHKVPARFEDFREIPTNNNVETGPIRLRPSTRSTKGSQTKPLGINQDATGIIRANIQQLQQLQQQQQNQQVPPSKSNRQNSLPHQNQMQYNQRLIINGPLYIPKSVAPIAPITTTLPQIVSAVERNPIISKRAAAYIAHQEEQLPNHEENTNIVMTKITKYLELPDLLNLRLVNKRWKTVVDSEEVWRRVRVKGLWQIVDWSVFIRKILFGFKTVDLILEEPTAFGAVSAWRLVCALTQRDAAYLSHLKGIWIKTVRPEQHRFALELFSCMSIIDGSSKLPAITWVVRVYISDSGTALVPVIPAPEVEDPYRNLICYTKYPNLLPKKGAGPSQDDIVLVELDDVESMINSQLPKKRAAPLLRVQLI